MQELDDIIYKFKKRKTPGPDGVSMDSLKLLDRVSLWEILELLNDWWEEGEVPYEVLEARVVMIFKKGKTCLEKYVSLNFVPYLGNHFGYNRLSF